MWYVYIEGEVWCVELEKVWCVEGEGMVCRGGGVVCRGRRCGV